MKRILTILLLLVTFEVSFEYTLPASPSNNLQTAFWEAYDHVRKWEGNYCYLPYDKGGETYGGITRNFNKYWDGWTVLDQYKEDSSVYWNKKIPNLEELVIEYYYNIWIDDNYYLIKDPIIAIYIFDYRNTGRISYKHVQTVLREHGYKIENTGKLDAQTIAALNQINPLIFVLHLKELRKEFYIEVAERNPNLRRYLKGWVSRANDIS